MGLCVVEHSGSDVRHAAVQLAASNQSWRIEGLPIVRLGQQFQRFGNAALPDSVLFEIAQTALTFVSKLIYEISTWRETKA